MSGDTFHDEHAAICNQTVLVRTLALREKVPEIVRTNGAAYPNIDRI